MIHEKFGNNIYTTYLKALKLIEDTFDDDVKRMRLLSREARGKDPPSFAYNDDRGFFKIEFKTVKYQQWVRNIYI